MKKFLAFSIPLIMFLILISINSVSANEASNQYENISTSKKEIDGEKVYTYKYKDINITGDSELTEDAVKDMLKIVEGKESKNDNSLFTEVPGPGGSAKYVAGPYTREYTNKGIRLAADASTAYVTKKIPKVLSKSATFKFILNKFTNWSSVIKPTHVGSWVTKAYSPNKDIYEYYLTVVHYKNDSYDEIESVVYYLTGYDR